ncbi:MAG TPA: heparinase II/III family protein [Tepidisphaeraceae bacterium]|jgi:hypothetical protein|nr:heparinase II/III family protein [Tepidisphaeraceae bacterium]
MKLLSFIVLLLSIATPTTRAQDTPTREPQYPLKTQRMIYTDAEIATARQNVAKYKSAKKVSDELLHTADRWADMSDDQLRSLLTSSKVPRAFDVSTAGCPHCGHAIFEKAGQYGWIIDPEHPFKVKCPNCGSVYPSNDYSSYYNSGFKDKKGWDTPYVDDGWGWKDPKTGEKYWFVAFYNHWMYLRNLVPGINAMSKAYLLTGDKHYAHKAAVALERIAEVYPAMDYENQSRYGEMMKAIGSHYPGKIVNHIWECGLVTSLAQSYDAVWETLDSDADLQKSLAKTGPQIRSFIEANLLEDAIDSVLDGKIQGNFGMHQEAMTTLALARQYGDHDKWLGGMITRNTSSPDNLGLEYALYDRVFRDGVPSETSPEYNFIWIRAISSYAPLLQRAGYDVFALPKTHRLYDAYLEQIIARNFNADLGDSGTVWGGLATTAPTIPAAAFHAYKDQRFADFLGSLGAAGEKGFKTFESLLSPPIMSTATTRPTQPSRLLDGYGLGILNNPADSIADSMYYGWRAGHGHFDRLGFELFAQGVPLMPDLGYPDEMNDFVPGIYTWSKNTISHNCVVVDAHRQTANVPGTVELFANSPFARIIDVEAKETYPQCSSYRRAMLMVDTGAADSYFVDFFTVAGGHEHDYSLHGPPGAFSSTGGTWSDPQPGTLAGKDVPLGAIYDQPSLNAKTGYHDYTGSGFQHLTHVRTLQSGEPVAEWQYEKKHRAHLRIRVLPQEGQTLLLAEARVSPVKYPQILHYLIARRTGENLTSRFVSIIEPYGSTPIIDSATQIMTGSVSAVEVKRDKDRDLLIYDPAGTDKNIDGVETDAQAAVVTFNKAGEATRVFFAGGSFLKVGGKSYTANALTGTVTSTDPQNTQVRVKISSSIDPATLVGRVVHFENDLHRTAHPITAARIDDNDLVLTTQDDLFVGRIHVTKTIGSTVLTQTPLPITTIYPGTLLTDASLNPVGRVKEVSPGKIQLTEPVKDQSLPTNQDAWLVNVGPGDQLKVPSLFWWTR